MAYYGHPPPGYGGYQGAPPPGYGGYQGAPPPGYGGSAYNVNFGGMPAGAVPGFTVAAQPQVFGGMAGYGAAPPMQAPASMQYNYAQQVMTNNSLMNMQMQMAKQRRRRQFEDEEEEEEDEEDQEEEEEEKALMEERARKAEEKARQLQEKLESNDNLKGELRARFIGELLRRQEVSGTFEETQGVVFPCESYDEEDPVAVWYN
ncbi:hypothetical protein CAPTEDRAFT_218615, partial [Capitella teleta]